MFSGASTFNQDLSNWDVSSGTNFVSTNEGTQCIHSSRVTSFSMIKPSQPIIISILFPYQGEMFRQASAFDQDLSGWDVSSGTSFVSNGQGVP
jgi:hypothetical protein